MAKKETEEYVQQELIFDDNDLILRSANELLTAKYRSTLFQQKILDLCLAQAKEMPDGTMVSEISAKEIRKQLGNIKGNSLYSILRSTTTAVLQRYIMVEDRENNEFHGMNIINEAKYKDGVFTCEFNKNLKQYVSNLQEKYTNLKIPILMSFRNIYSYRLYQILSTYRFILQYRPVVSVKYDLGEIRAMVGTINTNEDRVNDAINRGMDWNIIADNVAQDKILGEWDTFKRKVLNTAKKELEESDYSEIIFDYNPIKRGKAGKVVAVEFLIKNNPKNSYYSGSGNKDSENISDDDFEGVELTNIPKVKDLFKGASITNKEILVLLKEADNDLDKISAALTLAKKQGEVRNVIGFIRSAIREGWCDPAEHKNISLFKNHDFEESVRMKEEMDDFAKTRERCNQLVEDFQSGKIQMDDMSEDEQKLVKKTIQIRNKFC